ncbi:DNA-binding response OmpR family regulator [Pseudomonas sp. JAI115]|uniref:response regulator transcription factor n=1 Tax=Pseudomonas sp. JAI115 TaxID=2723061 RepID=UPI00161D297E|nr:response regulator [Pseudomonas sp. JAI115]MBB6157393.1 DNA-binding response OmpR family regulator [Pseudomonas sp. JAI115]
MYKIAIIEDSETVNNALADFCRKLNGETQVDQFFDRASAQAAVKENNYSLIVLDIELPPERNAGVGIISENSKCFRSPVMVVSGLDSSVYRSIMYELDVWDYLEKPIAPDGQSFLAAAMRVLRTEQSAQVENVEDEFSIDPDTAKASYKGKRLNLPETAKVMLNRFYKARGELVSYEALFDLVKTGKNKEAIRQHIKNIRDALKDVGEVKDHIHVVRMKGVRWVD